MKKVITTTLLVTNNNEESDLVRRLPGAYALRGMNAKERASELSQPCVLLWAVSAVYVLFGKQFWIPTETV